MQLSSSAIWLFENFSGSSFGNGLDLDGRQITGEQRVGLEELQEEWVNTMLHVRFLDCENITELLNLSLNYHLDSLWFIFQLSAKLELNLKLCEIQQTVNFRTSV